MKRLVALMMCASAIYTHAQDLILTPSFTEAFFGGFTVDGNTYEFPYGAEDWGGVANDNTDIYPLMFEDGDDYITFNASVPSGGDVTVKFRFEYNPYPDTDPAFDTEAVTVSGADIATYQIGIPDQGTNTYSSFLMYLVERDVPVEITDILLVMVGGDVAPVSGCTDSSACNYDSEASVDDGSCLTLDQCGVCGGDSSCSGCTHENATNYDSTATIEDGSCLYSQDAFEATCGLGTIWDAETSQCIIEDPCGWNPDSDDDSLIGINDLLMFLSVFGAEWPVFNCGDPVSYHGYSYETVQIGEQCWFSENLKTEYYRTGDIILSSAPDSALWTSQGAQTVLYFDSSYIADRGRLYNALAVTDNRGLCPQGWHVPTDDDFLSLESFIGMPEDQLILVESSDGRGLNGGFAEALKSQTGWYGAGAGSDDYGLSLTQTGYQFYADGQDGFGNQDQGAYWTSSPAEGGERFFYRGFSSNNNGILRWHDDPAVGFGVRCLKDSE